MNSSIEFLGHAGFVVRHQNIRVLIDPWFYPAFLASWFPYPDNRFLLADVLGERFDYLYISHLHEDHLDEKVLCRLDRSVTVLVPDYRSRSLARRLGDLGFAEMVPLGHKQTCDLARGLVATMYLDTSHKEDSGLLLDIDGFRFLDLNDCNTPMSELPERIDLLAAQFSGAMWYPNCYTYPPTIMQEKVGSVRRDLLDTLQRKARLTGAKAYLPSAGPACFLDPTLGRFNDPKTTIFPQWEDVAADFARGCPDVRVLRLGPGDTIGVEPGKPDVVTVGSAPVSENLERYRDRRRQEWSAFYDGPEPTVTTEEVARYFTDLQQRNRHLLERYETVISLSCGDHAWRVRIGWPVSGCVTEAVYTTGCTYSFSMSPRVLRAILDEQAGWEEALLSLRVTLGRDPDVFDSTLMSLLRYGNAPIQTLQLVREQNSKESIVRDGLKMQRFCPHAGEDLAHAIIRDGSIECPRHHWRWDARTGDCIAGGSLKLRVEAVDSGVLETAGGPEDNR